MTGFRSYFLSTTVLAGISLSAAPALAQTQPAVPDRNQPTNPAAAPPTGPVEANPTPPVNATGAPAAKGQDIIITGTRIPQPNLTSAAPVTSVSAQDIKLSGSTRIDEILNQLPSASTPQGPGLPNPSSGTAEVDLRHLGSKRTLTLINGRRMTPGDPNQASTGAGDINMIPTSLVKRVEVLTGGASSVYGADAVAGVVNFIMDTSYNGLRIDGQIAGYQHNNDCPSIGGGRTVCDELLRQTNVLHRANYGFPSGSVMDGRSIDATITFGAGFDDGRGHVTAYLGYRKQDPVLNSQRDYGACTLNDVRKVNTDIAATPNPQCGGSSTSAEGNFLIFNGGSSTFFTRGPSSTLVPGRTRYNFAPLNDYIRPDERLTAGLFADYEINPSLKPYLEFMFMDDKTVGQIAPSGSFGNSFTINCDNPYMSAQARSIVCAPENLVNGFLGTYPLTADTNPGVAPLTFTDAHGNSYQQGFFQIFRRNVEGGPRQAHFSHVTYRSVVGMRGDLSPAFSYDAYYQYGRINYLQVFKNEESAVRILRSVNAINVDANGLVVPVGTPGSSIVCRDQSDPNCVPFNYFSTPSAAAAAYLNVYGVDPGQTSEQIADVNFTGKLGELGVATPWAPDGIGVNVGWEYRKESLQLTPDEEYQMGDLTGQGNAVLPNEGSFHVNELFAEAQVPIVEHAFIEELSLGVGYRKSWYGTSAGRKYDTDTYKIDANFAPIRDVRLRGSYNRAVRAPNIQELFTQQHVANDGSNDPCAGITLTATDYGCIYQFQHAQGGGIANPIGRSTPPNPSEQYGGLQGGNPDLLPEVATTKTVGVVLQPRFIPRLALTVDYWNIDLKKAIRGFGADAVLADCVANSTASSIAPSCNFIHRDAGGSLWLVPSGTPGSGYVVDTPNNVGRIKTDGFDFSAAYSRRLGQFGNLSLSFLGTYLKHYKLFNGLAAPYDCAGFYGTTCTDGTVEALTAMPKWRHKVRATLEMPFGLGASINWRHVGDVTLETLSSNPSLNGGGADQFNAHVKAQDYFDLALTYAMFGDAVHLRAGVNNVFDRNPPIIPTGHGSCPAPACGGNTFPESWDYLGRYLYFGATVDFKHRTPPPPPPPPPPLPPPPPPPPPAQPTTTCPDGLVIIAGQNCPAPPPPSPAPQRG